MSAPVVVEAGAPNSMKAWYLEKAGDLNALELKQVQIPEPAAGQVRVRVVSATTNPVDFKHASFEGISAFPAVFGCDCAGVVDKLGEGVTQFKVGDKVHYFGNVFAQFGTFAEFALADAMAVAPIPEGMSWDDAAVTPCALWTAYEALFDRMRVTAGQSVFVSAGAGGVGHFAIQLAKNAGAKVITTASGANVEALRAQGYTVIDYKSENVKDKMLEHTGGAGVDCALGMLGDEEVAEVQQGVKFAGQFAHIATVATPAAPGAFFNALTVHHVFTPGNVVRPGDAARFVKIAADADALVVQGKVKPNITKTGTLDSVKELLMEQQSGRTKGKMLIKIGEP